MRLPPAGRKHGLTIAEVENWKEQFLLGAENALRSRPKDEESSKDERIQKLERKIGQMTLDMDIMREGLKLRPLRDKTSGE